MKVDKSQFNGDPATIERTILQTQPSEDAKAAIQAGLAEQAQQNADQIGPLVAGLTLGSPDFQRR